MMNQETVKKLSDAHLEAIALSINEPGADLPNAGVVLAEIKRRERIFQQEQMAKQLEIAKNSADAAKRAAGATWAAVAVAVATLLWSVVSQMLPALTKLLEAIVTK
jgi:hypothetical protein